jgi:hypothetical protein
LVQAISKPVTSGVGNEARPADRQFVADKFLLLAG